MNSITELGEVICTDVLVVGGGISGLYAGIKAKEKGVDVLVVDKGGIGWTGCVPTTAGLCMSILPEQLEDWFTWAVRENGEYLHNQDWTYAVGSENLKSVTEGIEEFGLPFLKKDGELVLSYRQKYYATARYNPAKFLIKLKSAGKARGVRMLDKVFLVDLLRLNGKVAGAIGFGLVDGKTYIFKAGATIIANGSFMSQANKFFVVNTGEGIGMAYRAGAQLINAEIGPGYGYGFKAGELYKRTNLFLYYENALGEKFMGNYYPELTRSLENQQVTQDFGLAIDAMAKETMAGRGPIYIDFRKLSSEERQKLMAAVPFKEFKGTRRGDDFLGYLHEKTGVDPEKERVEVVVQNTCVGVGPIRVGLDCETTLEGLWAVGDACQNGSSWLGAKGSGVNAGNCIPFAMVSGRRGGNSAGEYAKAKSGIRLDYATVKKSIERMLAPFGRRGTIPCHEAVYKIQEAVVPVKYNLYREANRLNEAIGKIEATKRLLAGVNAEDHHALGNYFQAESMALVAGLSFKAALLREESRGSHYREDYPERDDKNWLKWIVIKQDGESDKFFTESVPIEKYRIRPPIE